MRKVTNKTVGRVHTHTHTHGGLNNREKELKEKSENILNKIKAKDVNDTSMLFLCGKRKAGITLIALIVTIIVLIILAAITINVLIGNEGLITKSQESATAMKLASLKEEIDVYVLGRSMDEKTGGELYPVIATTMDDIADKSSLTEEMKIKLLALANDLEPGEVPTLDNIDYTKFYKIDESKVPSSKAFGDLYLWYDSVGYKVIDLDGLKFKGIVAHIIIPFDDMPNPKYTVAENNTYKLYGDGTLKVVGQVNSISTTDSGEVNEHLGVKEFVMPANIVTSNEPHFSCGTAYVIDNENRLWAWGANRQNKLGLGHSYLITEPTKILDDVVKAWVGVTGTWVLKTDGKLYAAGANTAGSLRARKYKYIYIICGSS